MLEQRLKEAIGRRVVIDDGCEDVVLLVRHARMNDSESYAVISGVVLEAEDDKRVGEELDIEVEPAAIYDWDVGMCGSNRSLALH